MDAAERARRIGPRELSVGVTTRYRVMRWLDVLVVRLLFDIRIEGLDRWPAAPFCLVLNHHNGWDPMLALALGPALRRSMAAMLEAASVPSDGLSGALRQNGLLAIHYAVSRIFDRDETADLSKTMAALDSRLKMAERWAQFWKWTSCPQPPTARAR